MGYSFQISNFKLTESTYEAYVDSQKWSKRKREISALILWITFAALSFNLETIPEFSFHRLYGHLPPDRHTSFYKYPFKFDTQAICYAVSLWFSGRTLLNLHLIMWSIWLAKGLQLYQNPLEFIKSPRSEEARTLTSPEIYRVVAHKMCSEPLFSCDLCHADSNYGGKTLLQKKIYPVLASYWQLSSMKRCQSRQLCLTVWLRGMSNRIWMGKFFQATAISLGHSLHRLPGFLYCRMSPVALMLQWIICCASEAHSWGVRRSFPLWLKNGTADTPAAVSSQLTLTPGKHFCLIVHLQSRAGPIQ